MKNKRKWTYLLLVLFLSLSGYTIISFFGVMIEVTNSTRDQQIKLFSCNSNQSDSIWVFGEIHPGQRTKKLIFPSIGSAIICSLELESTTLENIVIDGYYNEKTQSIEIVFEDDLKIGSSVIVMKKELNFVNVTDVISLEK